MNTFSTDEEDADDWNLYDGVFIVIDRLNDNIGVMDNVDSASACRFTLRGVIIDSS